MAKRCPRQACRKLSLSDLRADAHTIDMLRTGSNVAVCCSAYQFVRINRVWMHRAVMLELALDRFPLLAKLAGFFDL